MTISASALAGIISRILELKPKYLKKFRKTKKDFYLIQMSSESNGINLLVNPSKGMLLLTNLVPELVKSKGFVLNVKRLIEDFRVISIEQPDLERIIIINLERGYTKRKLIIELFGGGNIILTDEKSRIIAIEHSLEVKDRVLKPGFQYTPPPPRGMSINEAYEKLSFKESRDPLIAFIINKVSVDKFIVNEALIRLGIRPDSPAKDHHGEEKQVINKIRELLEISKQRKEGVFLISRDSESFLILFKPSFEDKFKSFETIEQACDKILSSIFEEEERISDKERDLKSLIERLQHERDDLISRIKETKEKAEFLSIHHSDLQRILEESSKIKEFAPLSAGSLKLTRLDRRTGIITISIGNLGSISVKYGTKSAFEVINQLYNRVKRLERGLKQIDQKIQQLKKELEEIGKQETERIELTKRRKKDWYEKFRWFKSSDGIVVIGGRDAQTNEMIVKRYAKPEDIILHVEGYTGPFVLVPSEASLPRTLIEAAQFAASCSSAWRLGHFAVDVFSVKAKQLTKKTKGREFLKTGAFVVTGKKEFFRGIKLELAIGLENVNDDYRVMLGPREAVISHCKKAVLIEPGKEREFSIFKKIIKSLVEKLNIVLPNRKIEELALELAQLLPPGGLRIIRIVE